MTGRRWWQAGLFLGLLWGLSGPATSEVAPADSARAQDLRMAHEAERQLVPAEARGDLRFLLDAARFLDDDGGHRLEVVLRVPHVRLNWIRSGPSYRSELELELEVSDRADRTRRSLTFPVVLHAESFEETRRADAHSIATVNAPLAFAPYEVWARLSDLRATKATLLGKLRDTRKNSELEALLSRPRTGAGVHLSSLVFASAAPEADATPEGGAVIMRGGRAVHPNPTHFVGHENEVFPVYFEAYRLDEEGAFVRGDFDVRVRYRILDSEGAEVLAADDAFSGTDGRAARVQRFTVEGFPTGTYVLGVEVVDANGELVDSAYGDFHVLWSERNWVRDEQSILDEARVLLTPLEYEHFEALPTGEREAYLSGLWERVDPDPATPENERRATFLARVQRVERRFGGLEGGKLSDRGRLFVRYGAPDEVVRVRIPQRSDFAQALTDELRGSMGGIVDVNDPRFERLLRQQYFDNADAEIWKYFDGGDPILPDQSGPARGMAFILIDEQGVGFYRLIYSSVIGIM